MLILDIQSSSKLWNIVIDTSLVLSFSFPMLVFLKGIFEKTFNGDSKFVYGAINWWLTCDRDSKHHRDNQQNL